MRWRRSLVFGVVLALAPMGAGVGAAEDQILSYVDQGSVVFTNTPDRPDARPVRSLRAARVELAVNMPTTSYDPFIREVAREEGLDPSLIKAVALVESGFNPRAVSPKGARGLMQLMPGTALRYGVKDLTDPHESLRGGARHLRDLLDEFQGDVTLALAAYNAGSGAVRRHGGVPAYRETQDYVRKVQGRLAGGSRRQAPSAYQSGTAGIEKKPDGSVLMTN